MHEVVNQTIGQIRENGKFYRIKEVEKFYKTLRSDMGYNEIENDIDKKPEDDEGADEEGLITDNRKLNDMIKMQ
jgi:hypothetical protein